MIKNDIPSTPHITTEDHYLLHPGDEAYNYYDMIAGTIGNDIDSEGWFTFHQVDGTKKTLNGPRLCSIAFALRQSWIN